MFLPDPAKGLAEFRRVLRAGRRAALCVISTASRAPVWGILAEALTDVLPEHKKTIVLSFSLADGARLEQMLVDAGFSDVRVTRETRQDRLASFDAELLESLGGLAIPSLSNSVRMNTYNLLAFTTSEGL